MSKSQLVRVEAGLPSRATLLYVEAGVSTPALTARMLYVEAGVTPTPTVGRYVYTDTGWQLATRYVVAAGTTWMQVS